MKTLKIIGLILLCSLPFFNLGWLFLQDDLGANPVETLESTTGDWAIYFLLLTLLVPYLTQVIKFRWFLPEYLIKRTLGLAAFAYVLTHLSIYFVFDMSLSLEDAWFDIIERPFILVGMSALLLLIPLAITSTLKWQRRLKKHWFTLHKAIYVIILLGITHGIMIQKVDITEPLLYLGLFILLVILKQLKKRRLFPKHKLFASSKA